MFANNFFSEKWMLSRVKRNDVAKPASNKGTLIVRPSFLVNTVSS